MSAAEDSGDDGYFDRLERYTSAVESDIVLGEDHTVWQSLLRKVVSNSSSSARSPFVRIAPEDELHIALLRQWLMTYVPRALPVLKLLTTPSMFRDGRQSFVDHRVHPSLAFSMQYKPLFKCLHVHFFMAVPVDTMEVLEFVVENAFSIPSCERVRFVATDMALFETTFSRHRKFEVDWIEDSALYVLELMSSTKTQLESYAAALPDEYEFSFLTDEDADLVNETWKYKSEESIHMVRRMISCTMGCSGVRCKKSNALAAWCLTYDEGPLGMLFTAQDHRRKGLAKCVVAKLLLQSLNSQPSGPPPFCYIVKENEASVSLFQSMGFHKQADVAWAECILKRSL